MSKMIASLATVAAVLVVAFLAACGKGHASTATARHILPWSAARDHAYIVDVRAHTSTLTAKDVPVIGYGREVCVDLVRGEPLKRDFPTSNRRDRAALIAAAERHFCPA